MAPKIDPSLQIETLFITYDDVIRSLKYGAIQRLLKPEIRPEYEDYIDYQTIDALSDNQILALLHASINKNIYEFLSKKEFAYEKSYISDLMETDDIMQNAYLLDIGKAIYTLLLQKFIKKIYIYYPYNDERILQDLLSLYQKNREKIEFVTGDFQSALQSIDERITMFILNDIDYVQTIIGMNRMSYAQLMIANYGYNYEFNTENEIPILKIGDTDEFQNRHMCNVRVFSPTNAADFKKPTT